MELRAATHIKVHDVLADRTTRRRDPAKGYARKVAAQTGPAGEAGRQAIGEAGSMNTEIVASPSAAQSFFDQAAALKLGPKARRPLAGSIGATTTATMKQLGLPVDFEAAEATLDALVAALAQKINR